MAMLHACLFIHACRTSKAYTITYPCVVSTRIFRLEVEPNILKVLHQLPFTCTLTCWSITSKRSSDTGTTKGSLQSQARAVNAKCRSTCCAQEVDEVERVQPPSDFETANPSLHTGIDPVVGSSGRIKVFLWCHGIFLDLEAERKDCGELLIVKRG